MVEQRILMKKSFLRNLSISVKLAVENVISLVMGKFAFIILHLGVSAMHSEPIYCSLQ